MPGVFFLRSRLSGRFVLGIALVSGLSLAIPAGAQVFTVENEHVDKRFTQIQPTNVQLSTAKLTGKTRQELIRVLQAEQGFAMRPLPRGHHGLLLQANGNLDPNGQDYVDMITSQGMSVKPGDRIVLSDVKIESDKIVFDLNGGPDKKHRFLRHISIGANPNYTNPVVADDGQVPTGSRITLVFKGGVPEMTGSDVKALLAPLLDFGLKSPVQAYTDTLPLVIKNAILEHRVLVGMNSRMVLAAKGQPESKTREKEGKVAFEEWIYGKAPKDIEFIRFTGDRVTRVEVAKVGETPVIRTADETEGTVSDAPPQRTVAMGDTQNNAPGTSAPKAPPSLKRPGETLPSDKDQPVMQPVQFPKDTEQQASQPADQDKPEADQSTQEPPADTSAQTPPPQ